jgi:hypothetical protein
MVLLHLQPQAHRGCHIDNEKNIDVQRSAQKTVLSREGMFFLLKDNIWKFAVLPCLPPSCLPRPSAASGAALPVLQPWPRTHPCVEAIMVGETFPSAQLNDTHQNYFERDAMQ